MKDPNFLSHFIKEDIYLVKSELPSVDRKNDIQKHLILTAAPLSESEEHFLYKIFAAVNIEPDLLAISQSNEAAEGYETVFSFGVDPLIGDLPYYTAQTKDNLTMVKSHNLSEISNDDSKKRQLWSVLKSLFH